MVLLSESLYFFSCSSLMEYELSISYKVPNNIVEFGYCLNVSLLSSNCFHYSISYVEAFSISEFPFIGEMKLAFDIVGNCTNEKKLFNSQTTVSSKVMHFDSHFIFKCSLYSNPVSVTNISLLSFKCMETFLMVKYKRIPCPF